MDAQHTILIDADEAGRLLEMLPSRVTRLARKGELPAVVLPDGEYRYLREDLEEWVRRYRRMPAREVTR